ncbi:hypothetical protein VTO73DRAFT_1109 [Trametes versicolor]
MSAAPARPIIRPVECANCRELKDREVIKMCSGCRVMGYCSKECQRADWKTHKPVCREMSDGRGAPSRPPCLKVAERISTDNDVMCHIDAMLIKVLDLEHHPERAESDAVLMSCRVESTDVEMAKERLTYLLAGREPPPLPAKVPKLFQIGQVTLLPNESVPDTLNVTAERTKEILQGSGLFQPGSGHILVRGMWVSEKIDWATCYFARCITPEMIKDVSSWRKKGKEGEPPSNEPHTLADLIRRFDLGALYDPEMNKKLTIMVSTKDT